VEGDIDWQPVTAGTVSLVSGTAFDLTVRDSNWRSDVTVFDFSELGDGPFIIGKTVPHSPLALFKYVVGDQNGTYNFVEGTKYDSPLDMANKIIAAANFSNNPTVTYVDGLLKFTAGVGGHFVTDYAGNLSVQREVVDLPDFDLSQTEFSLVTSFDSALSTLEINDADKVSELLADLFEFGVTTDNDSLNTTVFAVTAEDDPNVTAIWAHTQSSSGDSTVDAHELSLLATVNTLGNEFSLLNFIPQPVLPV
jgi:hypothetical protein